MGVSTVCPREWRRKQKSPGVVFCGMIKHELVPVFRQRGRVAQWITRLPTEQKIPGSNPGTLRKLFSFPLHLYYCELLRFILGSARRSGLFEHIY